MWRQYTLSIRPSVKLFAVPLVIAGMLPNTVCAVAQDPIPFNAMMQSSSAQTALPPRPDSTRASSRQVDPGHVTKVGKTEIVGGFVLLGAGIATVSITALLSNGGFRPSGAKTPALYAVGAAASGVGVTLIAFGFHKRSAK